MNAEMKARIKKALEGKIGDMVDQAMTMGARHKAITALLESWEVPCAEGCILLLELAIGIAAMSVKEGVTREEALTVLERVFADKIRVAKRSAQFIDKMGDKFKNMAADEIVVAVGEDAVEEEDHTPVSNQRMVLNGRLVRHVICECGHHLVKEEVPLGKEYRILSDTVREMDMICGGCKQRQTITVGHVLGKCSQCETEHAVGVMALAVLEFPGQTA